MISEKYRNKLSSNQLKLIAIICMVIQHITYSGLLLDSYGLLESIGTITMPLIIFSLVEGYNYTKNIYKYFLCLIIGMFISEIPFRMLFIPIPAEGFYFRNIMATLALTLVALFLFDKSKKNLVLVCIAFLLMIFLASLLQVDYGFYSIILAFNFFYLREKIFVKLVLCYLIYITRYSHFVLGAFVILFIGLYNGKLSNNKNISLKQKYICKYGFYLFYPLHFVILYTLKKFL